jgi:hypothetical protein
MLSAVTPSFVTKALRADSVLFNAETILPPNPDKPEQIATKAPRHKAKPLVNIHL